MPSRPILNASPVTTSFARRRCLITSPAGRGAKYCDERVCKTVTGLATFSARIVIYLMLIRRAGT